MKRDFKGIWIPKEIWLNKDLTIMERVFLVEIDSLDNDEGCYASNKHFSEFFDVSKGRCTQIIKSLERKGLLKIKIHRDGKLITKRVLRVVNKLNRVVNKLNLGSEYIKQGYLENAQESNTLLNNTIEGERAFSFLKFNYEITLNTWELQNKKSIIDYDKFIMDFNDTVDVEGLEYTSKILFGRLNKYARNWVQNQNKFQVIKNECGLKKLPQRKIS